MNYPPHLYPVEYFVLLHGANPLPPGERGDIGSLPFEGEGGGA